VEKQSHVGCSWVVDQLIGIRDLEQKLTAALTAGDPRGCMQLHFGVAELNRWLDRLDLALDVFGAKPLPGRRRHPVCLPRTADVRHFEPVDRAMAAGRGR
jgi:hypothetical protein